MLVGIQSQRDIPRKDFVLFLTELRVNFPRRGPCCGTVFFTFTRLTLVCGMV